MKRGVAIFFLVCISCGAFSQDNLSMRVRKMAALTIYPDSLYFDNHTARAFVIGGIPPGCKLKAEFNGGNLIMRDSMITLEPYAVYKEADAAKLNSRYSGAYALTQGDLYTAAFNVYAFDSKGEMRAYLNKYCYIKPQAYGRYTPLSSETFDPKARQIMQMLQKDSGAKTAPGGKIM